VKIYRKTRKCEKKEGAGQLHYISSLVSIMPTLLRTCCIRRICLTFCIGSPTYVGATCRDYCVFLAARSDAHGHGRGAVNGGGGRRWGGGGGQAAASWWSQSFPPPPPGGTGWSKSLASETPQAPPPPGRGAIAWPRRRTGRCSSSRTSHAGRPSSASPRRWSGSCGPGARATPQRTTRCAPPDLC